MDLGWVFFALTHTRLIEDKLTRDLKRSLPTVGLAKHMVFLAEVPKDLQ